MFDGIPDDEVPDQTYWAEEDYEYEDWRLA